MGNIVGHVMTYITRKERTNVMTDITEHLTVMKKSMECASVMYVILEHYGTCNRNDKHNRMDVTMDISNVQL